MKNFQGNRGGGRSFGGGGKSFGGDRKFGGGKNFGGGSFSRTDDRPELHRATCATCKQSCEVPFRPNGSKPVYCRDCFKKDGDPTRSPRFERKDERGFDRQEKQIFYVTCDKCGIDCDVPFRPTGSKPVYCRNCFDKNGDSASAPRYDRKSAAPSAPATVKGEYADQFRELHAKVDMLIDLITEAAEDYDEDEEMSDDITESIEEVVEEVVAETPVVETPDAAMAAADKIVAEIEDIEDFDSLK